MTTALQAEINPVILRHDRSVGAESETISSIYDEYLRAVNRTASWQTIIPLIVELEETFNECLYKGWDGYGARPLSIGAYTDALSFLQTLPPHSPTPSVVPEPSGGIGLEWISNEHERFVISFDGSGTYAYAGIFVNGARVRGIESLSDTFPKTLRDFILRLFS